MALEIRMGASVFDQGSFLVVACSQRQRELRQIVHYFQFLFSFTLFSHLLEKNSSEEAYQKIVAHFAVICS